MRMPNSRTERHDLRLTYPVRQRLQIIERRIYFHSQWSHPFAELCDDGRIQGCVARLTKRYATIDCISARTSAD